MKITASQLIAGQSPVVFQRIFDRHCAACYLPEDSAAGDREIRATLAESFAETFNWLTSHVGLTDVSALRQQLENTFPA